MERMKRWIPLMLLAAVAIAMLAHGPIAQLEHYHEFADTRAWLGIPNAGDVLSNAGFLLVGAWGLLAMLAGGRHASRAGSAYVVFLIAITLTAFGSGYYHWAPDDHRLLWDRLPIALGAAALITAVHADTHAVHPKWMLPVMILAAVTSCLWWNVTADLRPYLFLQVALVIIPLWQWIYRAPGRDRMAFGLALVLYGAAKGFEVADYATFAALGFMSGHTLKHLLSVAAALVLAWNVVHRAGRPVERQFDTVDPDSVAIR